jgi:quinol monooxygenase YgiN
MALYRTARFRIREDKLEECLPYIARFVQYVNTREPGTRLYLSLRDSKDPASFLHVMAFDDEVAESRHRASDPMFRFSEVVYPFTVDGVQFSAQDPVWEPPAD